MKKTILLFTFFLIFITVVFAQKIEIKHYDHCVYFNSNEDILNADAEKKLKEQLDFILTKEIQSIDVVGHTDERGSLEYNRKLSQRRVNTVQFYLKSRGVDSAVISSSFKGETKPVSDNSSALGMANNRRVEIRFYVNEIILEAAINANNILIEKNDEMNVISFSEPKERLIAFQQFHNQLDKEAQEFSIDANESGIIEGKQKTVIYFEENSFCDCVTKEEIKGNINVSLKEYYALGDFLNAGLNTNSNDEYLQSAGTINMEVSQNGKEVCLKENQNYKIFFPKNKMNKDSYEDMNIFSGELDEEGAVNWNVMQGGARLENGTIINLEKCKSSRRKNYRSKMPLRDRTYYFMNYRDVWKKYKYKRSEKGKEEIRDYNQNIRLQYAECLHRKDSLYNVELAKFPAMYSKLKREGYYPKSLLFSNYLFTASDFKWINCDRFQRMPDFKKVLVSIKIEPKQTQGVKLILKSSNSIVSASLNYKRYNFGRLPKRKSAILVVYDYTEEDRPKLAKLNFKIGDKISGDDLVFKSYNIDDFKNELAKLN